MNINEREREREREREKYKAALAISIYDGALCSVCRLEFSLIFVNNNTNYIIPEQQQL
jgi:hypothetical protein